MTTGEKIKEARTQAGLTQKELATACGMADSAIRKYESGRQIPKTATLKRIADALGVVWYTLSSEEILPEYAEDRQKFSLQAIVELCSMAKNATENGELMNASHFLDIAYDKLKAWNIPGETVPKEIAAIVLSTFESTQKATEREVRRESLALAYEKLSEAGQAELVKRAEELALLPQYQKQKSAGCDIDEIEEIDSSTQGKADTMPE